MAENLFIENEFGKAQWRGIINLSKLKQPLSQTVKIDNCNIEVYLNDSGKPAFGQELNRKCIATFGPKRKLKLKKLQLVCSQNGTELLSFDQFENTFQV